MQLKSLEKKIKKKFVIPYRKQKIFKKMQKKHIGFLKKIEGKDKIRVIFLAVHKSVWKIDPVFKNMLQDPFFELEILVCPYISYGEDRMLEDMEQTFNYFSEKNYPVRKARKDDGSWIKLDEVKPDIVFFTNPHNLTLREYYEDAYLNYLSCYVPYHHEVGSYGGNIDQYDLPFHNAMWLIFSPHKYSYDIFKKISCAAGRNVFVTGYPMLEDTFNTNNTNNTNKKMSWQSCDERLRLIWAPHHTINSPELPYSNFLKYAEKIQELSIRYKDSVVWSFKPHPILKSKLDQHSEWGKDKADSYYKFWKESGFTQLDTGEYEGLFAQSDAMIHDCGSFLAEYLYFKKPVLYTMSEENSLNFFNEFGRKSLGACRIANSFLDIEKFIEGLIDSSIKDITMEHSDFYSKDLETYFLGSLPSEKIIYRIKKEIEGAR